MGVIRDRRPGCRAFFSVTEKKDSDLLTKTLFRSKMGNFLLLGYLSGVVVPACFCFTLPFRFSKSFSLRFVMISVIILDSSTYYPRIYRNHRCHYTVPMLPHSRHEMMHIELHSLGCETSLDTCCDDFLNRVLRLLFA